MKRTVYIALTCAILVLSCLLSACQPTALKKEEGGGFRNPKTDIRYYPAALNYYAEPTGEEPYARIKLDNGDENIFLLYAIGELDPERYLVDNFYTVYCAEGAELPTLYDLPCSRVGIYDTQVASNDGNITTATEITALKNLHKSSVFVNRNDIMLYIMLEDLVDDWYDLHFMGDGAYKGIYYQLKYGVISEDVIITEPVEKDANGHFIDRYPGVPYEITVETDAGIEHQVAKYNFGKEIMCDMTTGNCYMIESSLLPYITPTGE